LGGTGLYFKAITEGMVNIPNIPIKFRKNIRSLHKKIGEKNFFLKLIKLDPLSKNFINPSDTQRSIRAYEVMLFTKKSLYDWFKNTKSTYKKKDFYKIYIDFPRGDLLKRIEVRSSEMIKKGAITEVKKLSNLKLLGVKVHKRAIGISEIKEHLRKKTEITDMIE
jgi:tRNA dimethylallyltransferase